MRLYIASHSQANAKQLMDFLKANGHEIVSRWILVDTKFGHGSSAYTDAERCRLAVIDEEDVRQSDALVLLSEPDGKTVPGGKHVETGIALALGKPVFVIGRRENLFHWHPSVTVLSSPDELVHRLKCPDKATSRTEDNR